MSLSPTVCLPQNHPEAAAYFMHTIIPLLHEIQILLSKFCALVSTADRRHKDTDSSPVVISIDSYITLGLSEVLALQ